MRRLCLVIALAFLAVNASDSWGQSKALPKDGKEAKRPDQPAAPDQRGTAQLPAIIKILPADDAQAKAKQDSEDRAAKNTLDTNTIRLGILGLAIAFLQFVGIGIQAWFLKGTLQATSAAAQAAIDAASLASQHERAYLFAGPADEDNGIVIDYNQSTVTISFEVENSGRTVGILKKLCLGFQIEVPTSEAVTYQGDGYMHLPYDLAIKAGVRRTFTGAIQSPIPPITQFAIGYIEYDDIFKNPHRSRFCIRIDPDRSYRPSGPPAWNDWN
jgi:hypothetical protein